MGNSTEFWEVYDRHGNKTGRIHRRGELLNPGDFHLIAENWIRNMYMEGKFYTHPTAFLKKIVGIYSRQENI